MDIKEEIISRYFNAWLTKDHSELENIFYSDIIYSECHGPEYRGIGQIKKWFSEWNRRGSVLEWRIKQFVHQDRITVVEWYFKCQYEGQIDGFDGISLITFNNNHQITSLKEFQSKAEHTHPYTEFEPSANPGA